MQSDSGFAFLNPKFPECLGQLEHKKPLYTETEFSLDLH